MNFLTALASMLLGALHAQDAPLAPVGPWVVQHEANMCLLARSYGHVPRQPEVQLIFRQAPTDKALGILVVVPHTGARFERRTKATIDFMPSSTPIQLDSVPDYVAVKGDKRVIQLFLKEEEVDVMEQAISMRLALADGSSWHVSLRSASAALKKTGECQDQLVRKWGFDPELLRTLQKPAEPVESPGKWIRNNDYPAEALRRGLSGAVRLRFTVNVKGRAENCEIIESAGAALDRYTCALIEGRARYTPAIGPDGKPVATLKSLMFRWQIET